MGIEYGSPDRPDKILLVRLPEPWATGITAEHLECYYCSWSWRVMPSEGGRMALKYANAKCPVPGHGDPGWGQA